MRRKYLLDTGVCLAYIRGESKIIQEIEKSLNLTDKNMSIPFISVVTKAELLALSIKLRWGEKKIDYMNSLLDDLIIVDISNEDKDLLKAYADIDAYSQGRHPNKELQGSARNMGKNDLWIAATAYVLKAELVTLDADFLHLDKTWFKVHYFQR